MRAAIFNKLAFKFILTKQEFNYVKLIEKKKRLIIDKHAKSIDLAEDQKSGHHRNTSTSHLNQINFGSEISNDETDQQMATLDQNL